MRICSDHLEMAESDDNFIGVCWCCGNITLVESRHWDPRFREYNIPSKYIYSKGCRECTGNKEDNIRWMTILPEGVLDAFGVTNRKDLTDVAVIAITDQHNGLFTEYHKDQPYS